MEASPPHAEEALLQGASQSRIDAEFIQALSNVALIQLLEDNRVEVAASLRDQRDQLVALAQQHLIGAASSCFQLSSSLSPMALDGSQPTMVKLEGIDFLCPVCTELIFRPVTTPYNQRSSHLFPTSPSYI